MAYTSAPSREEHETEHLQMEEAVVDSESCDAKVQAPAGNRRLRWAVAGLAALGVVGVAVCGLRSTQATSVVEMIDKDVMAYRPEQKDSEDWSHPQAGTEFEGSGEVAPNFHRHDGNPCRDDEEHFMNLCYEKCSILTLGKYPYRCSPWQCGDAFPCKFSLWSGHRTRLGFCTGYDISGSQRKSCPHPPGACMSNEEFFMGYCYKKCSIIDPEYPFRYTANTCCSTTGVACALGGAGKSSPQFAVSGGADDNDPSTPASPHLPIGALTEDTQ